MIYSTWDWKDARQEVALENARLLASEGWNLDNVQLSIIRRIMISYLQ